MAAVVREVTCLVNSDNERNHTVSLSGEPFPVRAETEPDKSHDGHTAQGEGSYGDGRSVMPPDALDRTCNTMPTRARKFCRKAVQIARKVGPVGIED